MRWTPELNAALDQRSMERLLKAAPKPSKPKPKVRKPRFGPAKRRQIRQLHACGIPVSMIARCFDSCWLTISKLLKQEIQR